MWEFESEFCSNRCGPAMLSPTVFSEPCLSIHAVERVHKCQEAERESRGDEFHQRELMYSEPSFSVASTSMGGKSVGEKVMSAVASCRLSIHVLIP